MRKHVRVVWMVLVGALGMGAAFALSAGADDMPACLSKSGSVSPAGPTARCSAGSTLITVSGNTFKSGRRGTITINGVSFKRGSGRTLTINGNTFRTGTLPRTLTINGNSFRTGTLPNSLTINGNSFRTGTLPNSLTINGTSFRSSGNTLTINATAFGPGVAKGDPGPAGPPGVAAAGTTGADGPLEVASGQTVKLITLDVNGAAGSHVLVAGGFNVLCSPCGSAAARITPAWQLALSGVADPLVTRRLSPLQDGESAGASISELIALPNACGPCTVTLSLVMPSGGSGQAFSADVTAVRAGILAVR